LTAKFFTSTFFLLQAPRERKREQKMKRRAKGYEREVPRLLVFSSRKRRASSLSLALKCEGRSDIVQAMQIKE
jgi:hypothetical protein